jgi:hypothetical protein
MEVPWRGASSGALLRLQVFLSRQDMKLAKLSLKDLHFRNSNSKASVVAPGGPVVSMTTYGKRIRSVYLALESIAAGTVLPSRLILWLDDAKSFSQKPESLQRLEERGLEIRLTENYGPHKKYYPYLLTENAFESPLVTADDDAIYSRWWLAGLVSAHDQNSSVVNCFRAHVVELAGGTIRPYLNWSPCESITPSYRNFATGVSGCIYPTRLLGMLKRAGSGFQQVCPKADDIWLHVNALRSGFKIKQILHRQLNFPSLPGTQATGLFQANADLAGNDTQIKSTYSAKDIDLLISAEAENTVRSALSGGYARS